MNAARWKQVNDVFHAALDRNPAEREAFLASATAGDAELLREVRSLLSAHATSDAFLETPAWGVAPELILDEELTGKTIGPYHVREVVGRGGMGIVYAAEDTRLGREVALKALSPEYTGDEKRRERLRREARAAASLSHPAIATIYALEELDGELFIISELVRGRTLRDELAEGPLPRERLQSTLLDIADALSAAHDRAIVHRDIKPENVIRCSDGKVKILDFGLARAAGGESDPTMSRLTQMGMAIGTPGYMAPEQLSGGAIDTRTDIYAFGVLAAELATGRHPFNAGSGAWSAPEIESIIRRCLNAIPDQRYRNGAELAAALRRAATPAPIGRTGRDAGWWWRFHQAAMAIVLAVMPAMAWGIRSYTGIKPYGSWLFFLALALATISVTLRMNLLFIGRVQPEMLPLHRARVFPALPVVDSALAVVMIVAAIRLAGEHDEVAGFLIGLGLVIIASVFLIEPATTRAARLD
jgi:hypothetical protein